MSPHIGTLNEGPLHQALKDLYLTANAEQEVPVGAFVADVRADDDVIYEIQTGSFAPLKRKLYALVEHHRVVLVHPIAAVRYIVKLPGSEEGLATRRKSPKRGLIGDVVRELVSIPMLLRHPNFEVEVVLIDEDEIRCHDPGRVRRRGGWRVVSRSLNRVIGRHRIRCPDDLFSLVQGPLPEAFTTAELAAAMGRPRWLAQKLAYCLRETGVVAICGKRGNALVYQRRGSGS